MRAVQALSLQILDANGTIVGIELHARCQRVQLDLSRSGWRAATSIRRSRVPTLWCRSVLSGVKQSPSALRRSTRRSFGSSRDSTSCRRACTGRDEPCSAANASLGERCHQPPVARAPAAASRTRSGASRPSHGPSCPGRVATRRARPAGSGIAPVAGSSVACRSRATMHHRSVPRCRPNRNRVAPSGSWHCARCSRRACRRADRRCPAAAAYGRDADVPDPRSAARRSPSAGRDSPKRADGTPERRSPRAGRRRRGITARLQHHDAHARFRQPRGERAAAGARADDHIVASWSVAPSRSLAAQNVFRNSISARLSLSLNAGSPATSQCRNNARD